MQRKNYILKTNPHKNGSSFLKKRSGFAMIMAIIVIVVISGIMALSLSLTAETTKRTVDLYLYEQAILYSKSAAELALLDIAKNGCINSKDITFDGIYDANITMQYIYTGVATNADGTITCTPYNPTSPIYITTPEQNGSVLMDITVSVRADANVATEPIRYFRRSIQKL
ncbi:MAG: hypothetical protein KGZ62_06590 [Sulfurimonas sp.]|nr:hypothetical protein [Sulfurimonas sp.]